jgi:hypothetical protein
MQTALAYNNSLLRFNNYVIDPGSTPVPPGPVGPSDYKLVLSANDSIRLRGFNPNVTSGEYRGIPLNQTNLTNLNSTDSYYAYEGSSGDLTLVITNVSVNTLLFTYRCGIEESGISYTLYRIVDGTDTQISSGTLQYSYQYTEATLNLT